MVQLQLLKLGITEQGEAVVILSDLELSRILPIWIGVYEANAIAMEIRGERFDRPLTHDLFQDTLITLGYKVDRVEINRLEAGTFYALLWITDGEKQMAMDSRPSDALAMAVRFEADIWVEEYVFEEAGIIPDFTTPDEEQDEDAAFRALMERVRIEDAADNNEAADNDQSDSKDSTEGAE